MNSNWSYSPETPNLGQIRRFFELCDLEICRMTLKNNRAPLLSIIKLCASFHHKNKWAPMTLAKWRRNLGEAKIKYGCRQSYWKWKLKINGHKDQCNTTFPTKCGINFLLWSVWTSNFKMATGSHIENITLKQMDIGTHVIPLFLLNVAWKVHFWHHFCILKSLNIKIEDGHHMRYPFLLLLLFYWGLDHVA